MNYQELGNALMYDENTKHCINFMTGDTKLSTGVIPGYTVVDVGTYRKFIKLLSEGIANYPWEPVVLPVNNHAEMNSILRLLGKDGTIVLLDTEHGYSIHNNDHVVAYVFVKPETPYRLLERDHNGISYIWEDRVLANSVEDFVNTYDKTASMEGCLKLKLEDFGMDKYIVIQAEFSTTGKRVVYLNDNYIWV
jgi:hypothetical protein